MSINVNLSLRVDGLSHSDSASVMAAVQQVLGHEGLTDDVVLTSADGSALLGHTPYPLIISSFHRWHGGFEAALRSAVTAAAPNAVVAIDWGFPDEP